MFEMAKDYFRKSPLIFYPEDPYICKMWADVLPPCMWGNRSQEYFEKNRRTAFNLLWQGQRCVWIRSEKYIEAFPDEQPCGESFVCHGAFHADGYGTPHVDNPTILPPFCFHKDELKAMRKHEKLLQWSRENPNKWPSPWPRTATWRIPNQSSWTTRCSGGTST